MTPLSSAEFASSREHMATAATTATATAADTDTPTATDTDTPTVPVNNPSSTQRRPASYIKVIDLAQSYNIDAEKIKVEIDKINSSKQLEAAAVHNKNPHGGKKEDSHPTVSMGTDHDSECSGGKKHQGVRGVPKGYPKRFSAMNGGYNLCLLVGKVDVVVDKLRVDKSRVRLAEVQVGDETGSISLRARDFQIDELLKVSKEGGAIVLRNSSIELFQGKHLRLAVTKWGKIGLYPDNIASTPSPPSTINIDVNLSLVDLNLVPPDVWLQPPPTSPASQMSSDSISRQSMASKHNHSNQQGHHNQYRNKGRGRHDKRYQPHQPYMAHGNTSHSSRAEDQNYNQMLGMTQNMMANMNAFSPVYPAAQYYPNYGDARMQNLHQSQQLEQQKRQTAQQQFLFMQQQHFRLQQQMEQMEQLLYSGGQQIGQPIGQQPINQSTQSQTSANFTGDHSLNVATNISHSGEVQDLQIPQVAQNLGQLQQSPMGSHAQLGSTVKNERRDSINHDSSMSIEVPMSPQMNPNATSFAPHFNIHIPDLGSGLHQGPQQYFLPTPTPQAANFPRYNTTSPYSHTVQPRGQEEENQNNDEL